MKITKKRGRYGKVWKTIELTPYEFDRMNEARSLIAAIEKDIGGLWQEKVVVHLGDSITAEQGEDGTLTLSFEDWGEETEQTDAMEQVSEQECAPDCRCGSCGVQSVDIKRLQSECDALAKDTSSKIESFSEEQHGQYEFDPVYDIG
jgi:hypothetical protein